MIEALKNQYSAALDMLSNCIRNYRDDVWYDKSFTNPTWQLAYHAIYYANIYCSPTEEEIVRWEKTIDNYQIIGKTPWPPHENIKLEKEYSRQDMLEFIEFVKGTIQKYLFNMKPDRKCWPEWYNLNQFEFQINNLRHIQHHTAQLIERHEKIEEMSNEWLRTR